MQPKPMIELRRSATAAERRYARVYFALRLVLGAFGLGASLLWLSDPHLSVALVAVGALLVMLFLSDGLLTVLKAGMSNTPWKARPWLHWLLTALGLTMIAATIANQLSLQDDAVLHQLQGAGLIGMYLILIYAALGGTLYPWASFHRTPKGAARKPLMTAPLNQEHAPPK
ncbi:hypothetical protein [Roseovarius sp. MMSF_3281]|uniref:hypothetical protein n=1 Tax=Roseovarius sp. MMSF_3281 TaxID=3046694 RepID=UPI00273E9D76|nr:hypothetical protein [Roseovarius sp. MMSF_3281]